MREIELGPRRLVEGIVSRVADDPYHFGLERRAVIPELELRTDRIGARPVLAGGGAADEHDLRRPGDVPLVEQATAHERDSHRLEIIPRCDVEEDPRVVARRRRRTADDGDDALDIQVGFDERHRGDRTRRGDARQRANVLDHAPDEERAPFRLLVAPIVRKDLERSNVIALKPGVDLLDEREASQEQPGADDEQQRQRHLDDDERSADAAAGTTALSFAERSGGGGSGQLHCRRQAGDHRGEDRQA